MKKPLYCVVKVLLDYACKCFCVTEVIPIIKSNFMRKFLNLEFYFNFKAFEKEGCDFTNLSVVTEVWKKRSTIDCMSLLLPREVFNLSLVIFLFQKKIFFFTFFIPLDRITLVLYMYCQVCTISVPVLF